MIDTSKIHHLLFKDGHKRQIKFLDDGSTKGYGKTWKLINGIVYVFDANRFVIGEFSESEVSKVGIIDINIEVPSTNFINIVQPKNKNDIVKLINFSSHHIKSAKWGIEGNYKDVTEKARKLFDVYDRVDATVNNFGDHIKGKRKHLKINDTIVQENISYHMKQSTLNSLKQWGIKDQNIFDFINNSKQIFISRDNVRINIYNDQNICYICSPPNNGAGLYCYVIYYLHALNHAKQFNSKILMSTKDGWSLYKNTPDDDLYSNVFSYNANGKNDLEKYFSPSQRVIDTITLLKSKYNIDPTKTIGVMARGTDKSTEVTLPLPEQYIDKCNDILSDNPDYKILLQTDEQHIVDLFIQNYGNDKIILVNEIPRSSDGKNVFHRELSDKIGICVYLDAVIRIISECQYVVKLHKGGIAEIIDKYRGNKDNIFYIKNDKNLKKLDDVDNIIYIKNDKNLKQSELVDIINDKQYNQLKKLVWYVSMGDDKYYEQTKISINSLLNKGNYKGDIIVLSDNDYFNNISPLVKFINIDNEYKLKCGYEKINKYYSWCAKSEIINYIDITQYDICMYIDSDVIIQKDINRHLYSCYVDKGIHIQNNGWYSIGRNHESTGSEVLTKSQITEYSNISICAGLFMFYGHEFGLDLIKKWEFINKQHFYKNNDQGNLTKIIIENYLDRTKYLNGASFSGIHYNKSLTFAHLGGQFDKYMKQNLFIF